VTTVYGLANCDTTKKARNWLTRFAIAHEFVDYRDQRQAPDTLKAWRDAVGGWEALVNKQSTTWRNLPEARKVPHSDPEWTLLLKEYPQLVKRPLLVTDDGKVSVGFTDNGWKKRFGIGKT
jgi:Spx/MgsR family transcriptional regulator